MSNKPIKLSRAEIDSSAWDKVRTHAQQRLMTYTLKALNPRASEADRLGAAWCASELRELLKLAEPVKERAEPEDD